MLDVRWTALQLTQNIFYGCKSLSFRGINAVREKDKSKVGDERIKCFLKPASGNLIFADIASNCFKQRAHSSLPHSSHSFSRRMQCSWWLQFMVCCPAPLTAVQSLFLYGFGLAPALWRIKLFALVFYQNRQTAFLKPGRFAAEQQESRNKWLTVKSRQTERQSLINNPRK